MNIKNSVITTALLVTSLAAHAGHWQIADGFCQTQSQDGQFTVRIKPGTIGVIEHAPNCNGRGEFPMTGSNVVFNQTSYPSSAYCTGQTQYRAIQIILDTKDIAAVIFTLKKSDSVPVSTFGTQFEIDTSGFTSTCAAIINQKVADFDPQEAYRQDMARMGYKQDEHGQWQKQSRLVPTESTPYDIKANEEMKRYQEDMKREALEAKAKADRENDERRQSALAARYTEEEVNAIHEQRRQAVESSRKSAAITPSLDTLTPEIYDQALERAQSTYLLAHPGTDLSDMAWEQIHRPDQDVNGQMMRMLRYTTFNPATGVTSDVDVEIASDGTVGYAINNDRTSPSTTVTTPPPTRTPVDHTVNAFCTLGNGKTVSVYAAEGQDYRYTYSGKNDRQELELVEGLFGVKAFHYYTPLGMGAAHYIRFNKGTYDYVLLSKDTGKEEFYGLRVYNNGNLISSHECKTALTLNTKDFSQNDHADSDKIGNYFIH